MALDKLSSHWFQTCVAISMSFVVFFASCQEAACLCTAIVRWQKLFHLQIYLWLTKQQRRSQPHAFSSSAMSHSIKAGISCLQFKGKVASRVKVSCTLLLKEYQPQKGVGADKISLHPVPARTSVACWTWGAHICSLLLPTATLDSQQDENWLIGLILMKEPTNWTS